MSRFATPLSGSRGPHPPLTRDPVTRWWSDLDRAMLILLLGLAAMGILLSMAGSPAVARTHGLALDHFLIRQILFLGPAIAVLLIISALTVRQVVGLCVGLLGVCILGLGLCLLIGTEVNGARRWLDLGPFLWQPSEFAKPAFVVTASWLVARGQTEPRFPGLVLAFGLFLALVGLIMAQPDFGQTVLLTLGWAAIFFLAGTPLIWSMGLGAVAILGSLAVYSLVPHVASRVDRFLDPGSGDTFQTDQSVSAFQAGGLFGEGPGEGEIKQHLPDAHTDFIFAVAGEEYGLFLCLAILTLFGLVVLRGFLKASRHPDLFGQLAVAGLMVLFGAQALVNMGVNLGLLPAKGMTLPFISYGGSSLLASAVAMGIVLALTRRRPRSLAERGRP